MSSYYNNIPIIQNITVDYGNIDTLDAKTVKTDNLFIDNDKSAENIITQSITLDTNKIEEIQLTSESTYASNNDKIMSSGRINELLAGKFSTSNIIKNNATTSPSDTKIYSSLYVKNMLDNKIDDTELNNYYNKTETDNLLNDKVNNSTLNNYVQKNDTSQLTLNNSNSTITLNTLTGQKIVSNQFQSASNSNNSLFFESNNSYFTMPLQVTDSSKTGLKTYSYLDGGNTGFGYLGIWRDSYYPHLSMNKTITTMNKDVKFNGNITFDNTTNVNSIIPSTDTTTTPNDTSIPTTKWVKDNIISPDLTNYVQKTDTSQLTLNNTSSSIIAGDLTASTSLTTPYIKSTNEINIETDSSNTPTNNSSVYKTTKVIIDGDLIVSPQYPKNWFFYASALNTEGGLIGSMKLENGVYTKYPAMELRRNEIEIKSGYTLKAPTIKLSNLTFNNTTNVNSIIPSTDTTTSNNTSIPTTKWVYDKLYPIVNVLELIFDIPFNNNLNKVIIKDNEGSIPLYYYSVIGNPRKWQFTGNAVVLRNNTFTLYKNYIQLQQGDFYTYNLSNYDFKILTTYNSNKTVEHRDYMMASGYPIEINNYNVNNFQFATPYLLIKVMPGTMGAWEFHYYNDLKFVGNRNQATYTLNPTKNTLYFLCTNLYFSTSEYKFFYDLTLFYVSANTSSSYSGYPYHSLYSLEIDYSFHYNDVFNLDISTKPPYEEETNYAYAHHLNFKNRSWYNWNEPNGVLCDREQHEANVFYDKLTPRVIDSLT